jgi:hypothetical protein
VSALRLVLICDQYLRATRTLERVVGHPLGFPPQASTTLDMTGSRRYAIGFQGLATFVSSHLPQNDAIENALRTKAKMVPQLMVQVEIRVTETHEVDVTVDVCNLCNEFQFVRNHYARWQQGRPDQDRSPGPSSPRAKLP